MILQGDARAIPMADRSVQCCVTSPPYWMLRDYGCPEQLGQESTPQEYVAAMVAVFGEVWRVLRDDGTLWLNLGDSYSGNAKTQNKETDGAKRTIKGNSPGRTANLNRPSKLGCGLPPKQLVGIPWRVAFALQDAGWYLRSEIIWSKPNAMPGSQSDRPTSSHETIFLFSKQPRYYYDGEAVKEPATTTDIRRFVDVSPDKQRGHGRRHAGFNGRYAERLQKEGVPQKRALRDVWSVATSTYKGAHFATFPPALVRPCVLAGCPEGGVVLDPFAGSGTTIAVAQDLGRRGVGVEMNMDYALMAKQRTAQMVLC